MSHFIQLAPMQAMTDVPFMNAYHDVFGGFTEMMAPYIQADSNSPTKITLLKKHFLGLHPEIKLVPQLLSNDAKGFVYFANALHQLGYTKVNWNLGCPFPMVAKKQRGSGLLLYPDKIKAILDEIIPLLEPELSLKIRFGYHHPDEIYRLIEVFNQFTVNEIIVHARTAVQKYDGFANVEFFCEIFNHFNAPLIYNGDILRAQQVVELETRLSKLKGTMIGRGAFINPFITQQINGIDLSDSVKRDMYSDFYNKLQEHYKDAFNEVRYLGRMKHLWSYFSNSFTNSNEIEARLKPINHAHEFEKNAFEIINTGVFVF